MSNPSDEWRKALAPTAECVALDRLGEELTDAERDHLRTCARCQTELELFRAFQSDSASPDEAGQGEWIASELRRRFAPSSNVVRFEPRKRWTNGFALAAAAALVVVIGAGYWMQNREPSISGRVDIEDVYRSSRLQVLAPVGDQAEAPHELRWTAVKGATRYSVEILEVDHSPLWSTMTLEERVEVPTEIVAQFEPGKTVLWQVTALRGSEVLASSGTERFRVSVKPPEGGGR